MSKGGKQLNVILLALNLIFLTTMAISIVLMVFTVKWKRMEASGAKYFFLLLLAILIYNFGYWGEFNSNSFQNAYFFLKIEYISIPFQPYLWLMMTVDLCGTSKKVRKTIRSITVLYPLFVAVAFFLNPVTHLYYTSIRFENVGPYYAILTEKGPFYIVMSAWVAVIGIICMSMYYIGYRNATILHKRKYLIMMVSTCMPWLAVFLNTVNIFKIDCAVPLNIVAMVSISYGVFFLQLFHVMPIAMETVFQRSVEGITIVDGKDDILDYNEAFKKVYPDIARCPKGGSLSEFLLRHPELQEIYGGKGFTQFQKVREGQLCYFSAQVAPLTTKTGESLGKLLSIYDITTHILYQNELYAKVAAAEKKASLSEISFLQAQIKPHFLYNTLSVISSMISRNPAEAKKLVVNLSDYFRTSCFFDSLDAMTPLDKELRTVSTYVQIEKARFGERLNFEIQCDQVISANIPHLTLQPLVENAIVHGIMKKTGGGHVILSIRLERNQVLFSIIDDGIGMSEEMVSSVLGGVNTGQSVGLSNIQMRLVKYYGEGLSIESSEGRGTRVSFSVPYFSTTKE